MLTDFFAEQQYPEKILKTEAELDAIKQSGTLTAFDGIKLYYEFFEKSDANGTVVVVHGLSEFTRKYYEFTKYFLSLGFNVFLYDQRCHGLSDRLTDDVQLIHVDDFSDYVHDLETVMQKAQELSDAPIYIYSHSMGGAVAAFHLAKHQDTVKKAVLTSPMLRPCTNGVPVHAVKLMLAFNKLIRGGASRFPYSKDFNPEHKFKHTSDASYNRFRHNLETRINNEHYQSTPMSVNWVIESLSIKGKLIRLAKKITTPVLLLSAELDTVVKPQPHYAFAKRCGSCTIETVAGAKHSLLTGTDDIIRAHIERIAEFYADN